jgi:hypothetical protein
VNNQSFWLPSSLPNPWPLPQSNKNENFCKNFKILFSFSASVQET